jgi:hypothetical protein
LLTSSRFLPCSFFLDWSRFGSCGCGSRSADPIVVRPSLSFFLVNAHMFGAWIK